MAKLQYLGYNMEDRVKIYRKAKNRFNDMVERDESGEEPLYRSKNWKKVERNEEKRRKKGSWFRGDGSEASTPGSQLAE